MAAARRRLASTDEQPGLRAARRLSMASAQVDSVEVATFSPTPAPSPLPSTPPSPAPTRTPTPAPSPFPTALPTALPTAQPTSTTITIMPFTPAPTPAFGNFYVLGAAGGRAAEARLASVFCAAFVAAGFLF